MVAERNVLTRFARIAACAPAEISRGHVERWLEDGRRRLAPSTVVTQFGVIRVFCRWLLDEGTVATNPLRGVPLPKAPRRPHRNLSGDQVGKLLDVCENDRDELIVLLGVQLGLRRAEIARIDVADIDWSTRSIRIAGKGGHVREVPLTVEAELALERYLDRRQIRSGWLFPSSSVPGRPTSIPRLGERVTELCYLAGIKRRAYDGVSTHALRHTAASDVWASTRDLLAVKELLGHSSVATTQVYVAGLGREALREAIEGRVYGRWEAA